MVKSPIKQMPEPAGEPTAKTTLKPGPKPTSRPRHPRRPELSRLRILNAAIDEFSEKGPLGGRIDVIAEKAEINKAMIYHYFGNKDGLYQAVIEKVYADLWEAEANLKLDSLAPREALVALVTFVWTYYLAHPEFIKLLNSENQLKADRFQASARVREGASESRLLVEDVLRRGEGDGSFRSGIDPVQLSLTITSICFYYLSNHYTSSIVYGRKLTTRKALEERLAFNIETILAIVLS